MGVTVIEEVGWAGREGPEANCRLGEETEVVAGWLDTKTSPTWLGVEVIVGIERHSRQLGNICGAQTMDE